MEGLRELRLRSECSVKLSLLKDGRSFRNSVTDILQCPGPDALDSDSNNRFTITNVWREEWVTSKYYNKSDVNKIGLVI